MLLVYSVIYGCQKLSFILAPKVCHVIMISYVYLLRVEEIQGVVIGVVEKIEVKNVAICGATGLKHSVETIRMMHLTTKSMLQTVRAMHPRVQEAEALGGINLLGKLTMRLQRTINSEFEVCVFR